MLMHESALVIFVSLLAMAAFNDIRTRIIPNRLSLILLVLWPLDLWLTAAASSKLGGSTQLQSFVWAGAQGISIGLASFLVGAFLFARGGLGGGDVKLLSIVGMWAGPRLWLPFIVVTALAGGVLAIAIAIHAIRVNGFKHDAWRGLTLPYGVAIACGGLYVAATLPHV